MLGLLLFFMLATLGTLVLGFVLMSANTAVYSKYKNKLMIARVVLQAISLLLLVIIAKR